MDSNPSAGPDRDSPRSWLLRGGLACLLGLGIASCVGSAWSAYPDAELKALRTEDEAKIHDLRSQEITQLRIALGRRVATNRRADLYLRLAELYLEAYRAEFLLEGRVHERRLEQGKPDKYIDRARSKPYLALGIKACNDILRLGIRYDKLDQVYYFLGFNHGELGNRRESLKYFDLLTRKYPSSPLVVEAYRELGDAAFAQNQFRKAQGYYELAIRRPLGETAARVYHRLAWTYYRLKLFDRAVGAMKEAIHRATQSGEKMLGLREEALRDMAVFMTESGKVDEAIGYFQSVAGDKAFYPKALEKLGRQYERNVEPAKATMVYESLLKTHPDDEAAFRVRVKLVDLDLRRGLYKDALARLKGVSIPSGGESDTATAAQNLKAMVRRTATEHHETFRKKGTRSALGVAEEYYSAYLTTFLAKDDPRKERPEIQMYLADVKRELGKAREASELYRKVIDTGDKRYAKEAGALWTASLADAIKRAAQAHVGKPAVAEPSALEKEFVDAADELQDALGEMPEGREAALKAAQVLAGYKTTQKEAIKRARKIAERWPKSSQALTAARLWVQILADQLPSSPAAAEKSDEAGELKEAIQEIRENAPLLAADAELGGGRLRQLLTDQENRFKVGQIAAQEKEKDFGAAAKGYETFAAEAKKRDLAEKAYGNAVASYVKSGDFESAARVTDAWMKRYPKSRPTADAARAAATAALIQGKFEHAAALLEKIGKTGTDGDALLTAARLFEGYGDGARARDAWTSYLALYPRASSRGSALLALAQSQEAERQDGAAAKSYKACMTGPADVEAECGARLADLYLRSQDVAQAKATFGKVAGKKKGGPFVAYARYRLAELSEREVRADPLQLPEARLKRALEQRFSNLERLSRGYLAAVAAGGPWGIAALDRLAAFTAGIADEMEAVPPPPGADAATAAQFRKNIQREAETVRRKALETWATAYQKAVEGEVLSPALPAIADRLADARVPQPARAQGHRGRLRLAGVPADGGADGRGAALEKTRERLTKNASDAAVWVDYGNLLWGEGKPLLARLAYERALALDAKSAAALNNRGVVAASAGGQEDWYRAAEALALFREALKQDDFFLAAKMNRAALLGYYRLFAKARPLWDQILAKTQSADAHDGLAVALQGAGNAAGAAKAFEAAGDAGASSGRFVRAYHEAARAPSAEKCLSALGDLDDSTLAGFEKEAADHLKRTCTQWKARESGK